MQDNFETIREQLHDIRNLCGAFELKLEALEEKLVEVRASLGRTDSTSVENSMAIEDIEQQGLNIMERIVRIEQELKVRTTPTRKSALRPNDSGPLSERF